MLMVEGTHRKLPDIVRTHLAIQSISELRLVLLHLIALGGGLVWVGVIIPGLLPKSILELAEIAVPILLAFFAFFLFKELRARFRLARLFDDNNVTNAPEDLGDSGLCDSGSSPEDLRNSGLCDSGPSPEDLGDSGLCDSGSSPES